MLQKYFVGQNLVSYVYKYVGVLLASVFHLSKILWTYLLPVCIMFSSNKDEKNSFKYSDHDTVHILQNCAL